MTIVGVAPEGFDGTTLGTRPRCSCRSRCASDSAAGLEAASRTGAATGSTSSARLQAGRDDRAGAARRSTCRLPPDHQRRRGAAAEGHERRRRWRSFQAKQLVARARRARPELDPRARPGRRCIAAVRGHRHRAAHRLRQHRQPAAGARRGRAGEMAVRLSIGASRWQLVRAAADRVGAAGRARRRRSACSWRSWTLDGDRRAAAAGRRRRSIATRARPAGRCCSRPRVAHRHRAAVRPVPRAAQHAARSRHDDQGSARASRPARARRARFRTGAGDGADRAVDGAADLRRRSSLKSLMNVSRVDLGIAGRRRRHVRVSPERNGYTPAQSRRCSSASRSELAAHARRERRRPARMVPLLAGSNWGNGVARRRASTPGPDTDTARATTRSAPATSGRSACRCSPAASSRAPTALGAPKVAIVNEAFAQEVQPRARRRRQAHGDGRTTTTLDIEIVGLVQNAKYSQVKDEVPPVFFRPYRQDSGVGALTSTCARARRPERCCRRSRASMPRIDPNLPVEELRTMPQQMRENVVPRPDDHASCRRVRRCSRRCWRRSACTACSPTRSRSGRAGARGADEEQGAPDRLRRAARPGRPRAAVRLRRAGAHNVERRGLSSERDPWVRRHAGRFDRVLVDAPCSGCGTWRRNPDAEWRLDAAGPRRTGRPAGRILESAARLVKPGGRLVYATCSLLPVENRGPDRPLPRGNADFSPLPVERVWADAVGGPARATGASLSLTTARHGTDGFFIAVMERAKPPAAQP